MAQLLPPQKSWQRLSGLTRRLRCLTLIHVMRSGWCRLVFIGFLVLGYVLVPSTALRGQYWFWSALFILTFATSSTCALRGLKDKMEAKLNSGASWLSLIASLLGLSAVQFCSVNAVMCGSTLGFGLLSFVMPQFLFRLLHEQAVIILIISSLLQVLALYLMGCLQVKEGQVDTCRAQNKSSV
jgi:hypothetical protein